MTIRLKNGHRGIGYYHVDIQLWSEQLIKDYLIWCEENDVLERKASGKVLRHYMPNIRMLVKQTDLHHITIKKAIQRMKEKKQIIEVMGENNSRLFCLSDSPMAKQIRINKDPWLYFHAKYVNDEKILERIPKSKGKTKLQQKIINKTKKKLGILPPFLGIKYSSK